jgi:hypothetical protein
LEQKTKALVSTSVATWVGFELVIYGGVVCVLINQGG